MRQRDRFSQFKVSDRDVSLWREPLMGNRAIAIKGVRVREILLMALVLTTTGCKLLPRPESRALSQPVANQLQTISVDVATAVVGDRGNRLAYTGNTEPIQEVILRSQSEGQLLYLSVDVGDRVRRGQVIAEIDKALPTAVINQAQAELSARRVEVAEQESEIRQLQTQIEIARLELTQAQADAQRLETLYQEGAISKQDAELARTAAERAKQALRAAEAQVMTQNKVVAAAEERVSVQQAIVSQAQERESYTEVEVPISGTILDRWMEAGTVVRPGDELLRIGDFSQVKVKVEVSELDLYQIYVGQYVSVTLDAFPGEEFPGEVTRISPAADPVARLIPVEVTISNRSGRLGSGLLARANFEVGDRQTIRVPQQAIVNRDGEDATLFLINEENGNTVTSRRVILGTTRDGEVEIISGLEPGERYVLRSSRPLEDGDRVELSILSSP
ncbi:efflux RND transporter periplasmic adaptor subunit [Roseofilum sp. BLCC_M91]|uniref:Efflux RND transporter periplasmic adaptor subunit n=1 Tax=Roseofilum halophilum BLCC-M91 TaxID=3022259 RepID=A0ABT7BNI8_9CYAN|nr:efflux RND transporter periplasmic adaptor subunit [Roseofilum halophilum]MDJ1180765.1 efflux RND transporter periplasmic adaptor subunit [Roseofilum halophilum BLCC-M91]